MPTAAAPNRGFTCGLGIMPRGSVAALAGLDILRSPLRVVHFERSVSIKVKAVVATNSNETAQPKAAHKLKGLSSRIGCAGKQRRIVHTDLT